MSSDFLVFRRLSPERGFKVSWTVPHSNTRHPLSGFNCVKSLPGSKFGFSPLRVLPAAVHGVDITVGFAVYINGSS